MWKFLISHWRDGVEILLLAACIYQIYRTFRATRAAQILVGLITVLVFLTLVSALFKFEVIQWIITRAAAVLAFALIVIFQPELRNGLARVAHHLLRVAMRAAGRPVIATAIAGVPELVTREVGWKVDARYQALNYDVNRLWDRNGELRQGAVTQLRQAVAIDPHLQVLIVHGWNDLSCPFMGSILTVDQMPTMGSNPDRVQVRSYPGGHMFYSREAGRAALREAAQRIELDRDNVRSLAGMARRGARDRPRRGARCVPRTRRSADRRRARSDP